VVDYLIAVAAPQENCAGFRPGINLFSDHQEYLVGRPFACSHLTQPHIDQLQRVRHQRHHRVPNEHRFNSEKKAAPLGRPENEYQTSSS